MGNHDDGLIPGQLLDRFLQLVLVFGIDVGGGLVEDDDGRVLQIARAMEILCFSPPEREAPPSPITVS